MKVLHIGGVADGEFLELPGNAMSSRHSFRLAHDHASEPLRSHDYERQVFMVQREGAAEEGAQFMVWDRLPKAAVNALIEARLHVKVTV